MTLVLMRGWGADTTIAHTIAGCWRGGERGNASVILCLLFIIWPGGVRDVMKQPNDQNYDYWAEINPPLQFVLL